MKKIIFQELMIYNERLNFKLYVWVILVVFYLVKQNFVNLRIKIINGNDIK